MRARPPVDVPAGEPIELPDHPFVREELVWFRLADLMRFLCAGSGVRITRRDMGRRLRALGAVSKHHTVKVFGKAKAASTNFYGVPQALTGDPEIEKTAPP